MIGFLLQAIQDSLEEAMNEPEKTRVETRVEIPAKTPDQILSLLREQPELTIAEVAQAIDRANSTVERAIAKLKQQGKLEYMGPKKGGRWQVK